VKARPKVELASSPCAPPPSPHWRRPTSGDLVSRTDASLKKLLTVVVRYAALACAPRFVGSEKLVLGMMLGLVNMSMWSINFQRQGRGTLLERHHVLALMLFLTASRGHEFG
jgi:hypothetical protein